MDRHEANTVKVEKFMIEHKKQAFNREEVAEKTGVSKGAVRSILRVMYKDGKLEKQMVKERNGEKRVYYFTRRCESLAGQRCVGDKGVEGCPAGDVCCIFCERDCDLKKCEKAIEYLPEGN